MSLEKIHRVAVERLNLRAQPGTRSNVLVVLERGQAVVRLDETDRDGWWFVFADAPGQGVYAGHVWARFLQPFFAVQESGAGGVTAGATLVMMDDLPEPETAPPRETAGLLPPPEDSGEDTPAAPVSNAVAWADGWHPEVPDGRRHSTDHQSARPMGQRVKRLVIHITGDPVLDNVIKSFRQGASKASAHYLIAPNGDLHQFVPEHMQSHHAGIKAFVGRLYVRGDGSWRKYKRFFAWAEAQNAEQKFKWYGRDAVYLGTDGLSLPLSQRGSAILVQQADGSDWPDYAYFDEKWGRRDMPIGFSGQGHNPNSDSIGIEILSWGGVRRNPDRYSPDMYRTLGNLARSLCERHGLPVSPETVCGHEDVNPVERWGWDPNRGFEWDRLFALARQPAAPGV